MRQQQHNRLRNTERSPVTVSSYPCCSAAAFVISTIVALCWHVILSRSLFLTFSSAAREDVSAGQTVTSRHIGLSSSTSLSLSLSLSLSPFQPFSLCKFHIWDTSALQAIRRKRFPPRGCKISSDKEAFLNANKKEISGNDVFEFNHIMKLSICCSKKQTNKKKQTKKHLAAQNSFKSHSVGFQSFNYLLGSSIASLSGPSSSLLSFS